MPRPFENLTDDQLVERINAMAANCLRIWEMPEVERRAAPDGQCSPEQFGVLQAHLTFSAWNEALHRGLVDEPL